MFNQHSRKSNIVKSSAVSLAASVVNFLLGFVYRTVFIWILGAAYLGISGLFGSILSLLSLAELGITTCVVYRFYKPISVNDARKVGQLMVFFKWVYRIIAAAIFVVGMALVPFLDCFIADTSEVPADIDITLVYVLFLLGSVSTYLYSYRLTLLGADQRGYTNSAVQLGISFAKYIVQFAVLCATRSFTLTLASSIIVTLIANVGFSVWVTRQYEDVFKVKEMLPKEERRQIYSDIFAASCHKIGAVVLSATDNVVLSSFIGIVVVGLYSNYVLLMDCVRTLLQAVFTSFIGSIGNAHSTLSDKENYDLYRRLLFFALWAVGVSCLCIYVLINDFISLWLGTDYLLDAAVVVALCVYFFMAMSRPVTGSFTSGTGLFVKDKARPFIEAGINVVASIALAINFGIAGVVWGTIASFAVTVFWREPYIIHKYEFHESTKGYWLRYTEFALLVAVLCFALTNLKISIGFVPSPLGWACEALVCVAAYLLVSFVLFWRTDEMKYYRALVADFIAKRMGRSGM